MEDNQELLRQAVSWAQEAGKIQLRYFRSSNLNIEIKSSQADVVTVADKESEAYLVGQIFKHHPHHEIMGEETGEHKGDAPYRWVIDPLDGTTNFSQGLALFTVSIGIQYQGETVVGVVYAPYLNEMYTAVKGGGAFLNGHPIRVSTKTDVFAAVMSTGFPVDKDVNTDNNLDNFEVIVPQLRCIRRLGSAAYDLCNIAAGFLDGYWECSLHEWDVCAGILIVQEAGGLVIPYRYDRGIAIVAGNETMTTFLLDNICS